MTVSDRWRSVLLAMLRIVTALLFLQHGLMKIAAFPGPQPGVPHPLPVLLMVAGAIEVAGGTLIAIGAWTRIVAFVCSGEMAVAYWIGHAPNGVWPGLNGGDLAVLLCFVFLYLSAAGAGPWSVDSLRQRSSGSRDYR